MRASGLLAMNAAHRLAHFIVRGRGDGAGIQHHQIGRSHFARGGESLRSQPRFDRRTIGLRSAAPEILYEEPFHFIQPFLNSSLTWSESSESLEDARDPPIDGHGRRPRSLPGRNRQCI